MGWTYACKVIRHAVLGGIIATVVLLAALFGMLKWRVEEFDRTSLISLSIGIMMLWIIPWGMFIIIPLALAISFVSPAGREEWSRFKNRRIAISLVLLIILNSFALYPVSTPEAPPEWGEPITTENPHAAAWPASEQFTWLHDDAVIGIVNIRTPHTFSSWGQDSSSISLGVMMGVHDQRMRQSIESMNSFIPGVSIDPDTFTLYEVETEGEHLYGDEELFIARFDVKRDGFDATLANVLVVGFPNAGGELTILSITRPITSSQNDVFEEKIVIQYADYKLA